MRLTLVEVRRLLWRRLPTLAVLAALLVALMALFGVHQQAQQIAQARAGADRDLQAAIEDWEANGESYVEECRRGQEDERRATGDGSIDWGCDEMQAPSPEDWYGQMPGIGEQYTELLAVVVYPLLLLALAVGSTGVAAEFSHRTMGSFLTFVPRRVPVFVAKLVAAAVMSVPIVAVCLLVLALGIPAVYRLTGSDPGILADGVTPTFWMSVRILGLGLAAGAFGAAAAFVLRHSAVVIGIMVGYVAVVEGILGSLLPDLTRYLLGRNLEAVVRDGTEWATYVDCESTTGCRELIHQLSLGQGLVTVSALLLLVVGLGLLRFVRSDID
ncbi:ABC transporter permease subunit [Serinicoccus kebangsaanensis]|uniref:ABC transporter permease subunit n=1 Tax=Serinicoccus kebangsaanensis TaxID=2602069 RepID=UPI00124EF999|nr:ABC transporter permease subunit [Serinicoccus kebangsaanensis]